ncbi:hypothetical protein BpHYR1_012515 [Brachionus plicatilis]|uniref:Uncharacterized protein n=1 Tax=Brachionus plicatilis TaxID=10195 RepID=A0A3M7RM57_BRAPC|nr:hypothetical protein BpHYR1_012515 [Brachionus plicatilis]
MIRINEFDFFRIKENKLNPHWHSFTRSTWYVLHKKRNKRIPILQLFRLQVLKCVFVFDLINHEKKAYDIYFERELYFGVLNFEFDHNLKKVINVIKQ